MMMMIVVISPMMTNYTNYDDVVIHLLEGKMPDMTIVYDADADAYHNITNVNSQHPHHRWQLVGKILNSLTPV